jgi:hypothetical protein
LDGIGRDACLREQGKPARAFARQHQREARGFI